MYYDDDCVDLPSLTRFQPNDECICVFRNMGYVVLESILYFYRILFKYNIVRYSKSNE